MRAEPANGDTGTETERATEHGLDWQVAADLERRWNVLIHNDDVTPFDFVIAVLRAVFYLAGRDALAITARAHYTGVALVMTLPYEEAKYRVGKAHGLAGAAGYPLTFTLEPET